MVNVQAQFDLAVAKVKAFPPKGSPGALEVSQDTQLSFYGLFKQATEGDCNTPAPGMMDFAGKYKHKAWKAVAGTSKEDAQKKYVQLLKDMLEKDGSAESKATIAELDGKFNQPLWGDSRLMRSVAAGGQ
ncbi:hypothetical protein P7C73_g4529, partial [Tremellales sp. Uapishka_1]